VPGCAVVGYAAAVRELLRWPGQTTLAFFAGAGRVVAFFVAALAAGLRERGGLAAASQQALALTARCALPVVLVVAPIGAMLALQSLTLMRSFGAERQLAPLAVAVIVRELAPGFAAVVVAMQGGAAIAAELATMRLSEELDALEGMGVDPKGLIAGPRILGAALAAPLLNALAILTGIAGAYAMAVLGLGVARATFLDTLLDGLTPLDVWVSEGKTVIFGLGLGAICASAGFHAQRTTQGVGLAANRAVVASVVFVLVVNYVLNTAIFGLRGGSVAL
jgi:phospholipid/cholesterol/gamma-HCH transport system permease protein